MLSAGPTGYRERTEGDELSVADERRGSWPSGHDVMDDGDGTGCRASVSAGHSQEQRSAAQPWAAAAQPAMPRPPPLTRALSGALCAARRVHEATRHTTSATAADPALVARARGAAACGPAGGRRLVCCVQAGGRVPAGWVRADVGEEGGGWRWQSEARGRRENFPRDTMFLRSEEEASTTLYRAQLWYLYLAAPAQCGWVAAEPPAPRASAGAQGVHPGRSHQG